MGYFFNASFSRFSWARPCTDRQTDIRPRYVQHRQENAALRVDDAAWNTADGDCRRKSNARWGLHVSTQPISHGVQMRCPVGVITSLKNATRHPTRIAYSASGSSESRQPNVETPILAETAVVCSVTLGTCITNDAIMVVFNWDYEFKRLQFCEVLLQRIGLR